VQKTNKNNFIFSTIHFLFYWPRDFT